MSALKELTKYIETKHPANDSHYIKLILEAIREGEIRTIYTEGILYEINVEVLETKE